MLPYMAAPWIRHGIEAERSTSSSCSRVTQLLGEALQLKKDLLAAEDQKREWRPHQLVVAARKRQHDDTIAAIAHMGLSENVGYIPNEIAI